MSVNLPPLISSAGWLGPLSDWIHDRLGLRIQESHWNDLHRNFINATESAGYTNPEEYRQWLMQADLPQAELHKLAGFLTIGETYFFREKNHFEPMTRHLFNDLITKKRKSGQKQLRIWSAACSSGEEPYSLAILLDSMLPDIEEWSIRILATDINPEFLEKARTAVYRPWSFRGTPEWVKQRYFDIENDNHALHTRIRERVTFDFLNLAGDSYPSLATQTEAMDLIFCRNVLIYFGAEQARGVIGRLQKSLTNQGWLVLSPTETIYVEDPALHRKYIAEAILYQKDTSTPAKAGAPFCQRLTEHHSFYRKKIEALPPFPTPAAFVSSPRPALKPSQAKPKPEKVEPALRSLEEEADFLFSQGRHTETTELIVAHLAGRPPRGREAFSLARAQANLGELDEALAHVLNAVETDKLCLEYHYLLAMIQLERASFEEAARSLQRVVYLDDQHVMALFSLGHLSMQQQKSSAAKKYFQHALQVLNSFDHDIALPEGEGMTADRLRELIQSGLPK